MLDMTLVKHVFKQMNNSVFRKTMVTVRKHRNNKLVTSKRRKNYLVLEANYSAAV